MVTVRPAEQLEVQYLQERLASEAGSYVDLNKSIVYIAEEDGFIVGIVEAHLMWQVGSLSLFSEFKNYALKAMQRRATLLLGRAIDAYIRGDANGFNQIHEYFAIVPKEFADLALHFGLHARPKDEIVLEGSDYYGRTPGESGAGSVS